MRIFENRARTHDENEISFRRRRRWNSLAEWGVIRALLCGTL